MASGRIPVGMLLPQLGLVMLNWLPMILPLANPRAYYGPGLANLGVGVPVGK